MVELSAMHLLAGLLNRMADSAEFLNENIKAGTDTPEVYNRVLAAVNHCGLHTGHLDLLRAKARVNHAQR